jgi:hypothetical protein
MRFALMVVAAVATGALAAGAIQTMIPQTAQKSGAVQALGANWTDFKISDLNPISMAYRYVIKTITSGEPRIALRQAPPILSTPIDLSNFNVGLKIDEKEIARFNADAIASQIQENNRRMQDMAAFARNPAAWHGMPPH